MIKLSPMMMLPIAVFAGFAGLAGWALVRDNPEIGPSAIAGRSAPAVPQTTLTGKVQLTDAMLREPGVKLVNFWASWCPPCRAEHPTVAELAKDLPVYGIDLKDPEDQALKFLTDYKDAYHALSTDPRGRTAIDWGVTAPPETFIVNGKGEVVYRFAGPLIGTDYETRFLPELQKALDAEK